jgi:hypothetical protein
MQADPKPEETPRQPKPDEQGAPICTPSTKEPEVTLTSAKASDSIIKVIKENNKYTPINITDTSGISGGYASVIVKAGKTL